MYVKGNKSKIIIGMVTFKRYEYKYYQQVCDFLIEINNENENHLNWNWARFEWMYIHPLTKQELLKYMGLWFDDSHLIGATLIDMYFGEAFVGVLKDYQYLYPEILKYAFDNLKDEQGLGITINVNNKTEINEAIKQGFYLEEAKETLCEIPLDKQYEVLLPQGFQIEEYDAQENQQEIEWLMWQGFNHGNDKQEFIKQYKKTLQKRPHFNKSLCIVIKNEKGALVASASTWYDKRTNYAYVEPVCVIPQYRKIGLGKAAVYQSINNARNLGATRAIVTSDQDFYKRIGFKKKQLYSFYWKKEEREVNGVIYKLEKLLGKGKGGYSYLAKVGDKSFVLKQIHHEPCEYYQFGNKIESEKNDYQKLLDAGINIPRMVDIDIEKEIIIKEYIDGEVISDLLNKGVSIQEYIPQLQEMARLAKNKGLNIDYYPTNFVVKDGLLYYIDYECNPYMDEWSLDNWGIKYWNKEKTI